MNDFVVTRDDLEKWWLDTISGAVTRREVATWAEHWMGLGGCEELVLRGGLTLQALVHHSEPDEELRALAAEGYEAWRAELNLYDADPVAWNRGEFRRFLTRYAAKAPTEKVRAVGLLIIEHDHWPDATAEDIIDALGPKA
jgi:hypothetical protein